MLQVAVHGPGDPRVDRANPREPGPGDVVVRVAACGICGSDLTYIERGGFCVTGGPMPLGHEISGTIDWVGDDVPGILVGQRVVVHPGDPDVDGLEIIGNGAAEGGLTERLVVRGAARGSRVFAVPDDLSLQVAALAEPVAVGMKAARRSGVAEDEPVAVFGCGPIGLAAIADFVDRGIDVVGVDLSARRRELAGELGARAVIDPAGVDVWEELKRLHGSVDFLRNPTPATHAYVEATGSGRVLSDIIANASAHSRLAVVALHMDPVPVDFTAVMAKQLEIRGSMGYPTRFEDAIELLARRDLSAMVTHEIPLERFHDALSVLSGDRDCGKVLVTMASGES